MVTRVRVYKCLGCGEGWADAQVFEKDGGTIKQVGISMLAFCECGNSFLAVELLDASRQRRKREREGGYLS